MQQTYLSQTLVGENTLISYLARVNYDFMDKYLIKRCSTP